MSKTIDFKIEILDSGYTVSMNPPTLNGPMVHAVEEREGLKAEMAILLEEAFNLIEKKPTDER